ncbi:hypothetical protein AGDE_16667 [Angomonas deanei]|nr:hypothetical protein AGDE_16667 [Angomonas deanei]|eukprot:EPY16662.1 hypothetical protein AGDE_16667 [Angomonas deanei]
MCESYTTGRCTFHLLRLHEAAAVDLLVFQNRPKVHKEKRRLMSAKEKEKEEREKEDRIRYCLKKYDTSSHHHSSNSQRDGLWSCLKEYQTMKEQLKL